MNLNVFLESVLSDTLSMDQGRLSYAVQPQGLGGVTGGETWGEETVSPIQEHHEDAEDTKTRAEQLDRTGRYLVRSG